MAVTGTEELDVKFSFCLNFLQEGQEVWAKRHCQQLIKGLMWSLLAEKVISTILFYW